MGKDMDEIPARVKKIEDTIPTLATKVDLEALRISTKDGFTDLRSEMKEGFNAFRLEFQALRADFTGTQLKIEQSIQSWSRWNHGAMIAMFATIGLTAIGLLLTMWSAIKPHAPLTSASAQPMPYVIYASPPSAPSVAAVIGPAK